MSETENLIEDAAGPSRETQSNYGSVQITSSGDQNIPNPNDTETDNSKSTLSLAKKVGFSLGHVHNDLCAGVWFSYTLLFLQGVLGMTGVVAGVLVMVGQVGDAIFTPIIGIITDKFGTKRKWHMLGTLLLLISFPMIFAACPFCEVSWWKPFYFSIMIVIFQFGWPVVQITHLSMVNELSRTQRDRGDLTASKYSLSIVSNVIVYCVTWAVLHAHGSADNRITPVDAPKFRDISLILTLIGIVMTVLFYFSLYYSNYEHRRQLSRRQRANIRKSYLTNPLEDRESLMSYQQQLSRSTSTIVAENNEAKQGQVLRKPKKDFVRNPLLYLNSLLYVFSRLFMTTSLVYMPLWLNERASSGNFPTSNHSIEHLATVPLVSFVTSFVASVMRKYTQHYISHAVAYMLGSFISIGACFWVQFGAPQDGSNFNLYGIATLIGTGSSITMISSLCIIADMIGAHTDQGGFIYATVTFCDKLITGIVIVIIESSKSPSETQCPTYYKEVLAYTCGIAGVLSLLTLLIRACIKPVVDKRESRALSQN